MFKCNLCGHSSKPKDKPNVTRVFVEYTHENIKQVYDKDKKRKVPTTVYTKGNQIAREIYYCDECKRKINGN